MWASEHVTRCSWELIHLVMATCHGNFVTNEKVTIALFISLKELLGLQAQATYYLDVVLNMIHASTVATTKIK